MPIDKNEAKTYHDRRFDGKILTNAINYLHPNSGGHVLGNTSLYET